MKLISKYNRVNILATITVLLVASACYYFIVRYVLIHQLDNTLKVEEAEIINYIKVNNRLPEATQYRDQHTEFIQVSQPEPRKFSNIHSYDERGRGRRSYRELSFPVRIDNRFYKAFVTKSEEEMEGLVLLIVFITIGVIILLLLILFLTNRVLLRRLWEPFYHTLDAIKAFQLSRKNNTASVPTNIDEFDELGRAVHSMHVRILKDYETLKNFTDNASHEMQTPLAILNSKLDLLIQEPDLNESQTKQLQAMYDALSRLTRLNQSLLLLTKIENNQFNKQGPVRLDTLVEEKIFQLEDLITSKHLHVMTDLTETIVRMDEYLADILLNNLLGNAIRHNHDHGNMNIVLRNSELTIRNSGDPFGFDESNIFERFKKSDRSEGAGLGLAIVKQICDNCGFKISYAYSEQMHQFCIRLK